VSGKRAIWIAMIIGSSVGGWIPTLWGAGFLSMTSVVGSAVGGLAGIWVAYRATR
jgi:hypothetical protein